MKKFFLNLFLISLTQPLGVTMADLYKFTVSNEDPGKIILAKDCLDYTFCGGEGTAIAGGNPEYRFHSYIELANQTTLQLAMNKCNFTKLGITVAIHNETLNKDVVANIPDNGQDIRPKYPNIYLKTLTETEKVLKFNVVESLLKQNKEQEAIDYVISAYGLPTNGYTVKPISSLGNNAGAITDHELKKISIAPGAKMNHPCDFIQSVRHELEHAFQFQRLVECNSKGKNHNFNDHKSRERSAYLNDIRNFPLFCTDKEYSDIAVDDIFNTLVTNYTRNQ